MTTKSALPFLGAFLFLFTACQDEKKDTPTFDGDQLIGRWEIIEAYRNGKKTETLTDTFYEFDRSGKLSTNLTPSATKEEYDYKFDGSEIKQAGGLETVYQVENLTDSLLVLSMNINKFPFRLTLGKVVAQDTSAEEGIMQ